MFSSPPRSILMALVVGGVTHDPINARRRLEQARAASAIAVARRRCIHSRRRHRRCRRRRCCRSSLSLPLQNAAIAFSASAIAAAAVAAVAIAVAAATTIAATAAVVDCYVSSPPPPKNFLQAIGFIAKPNLV